MCSFGVKHIMMSDFHEIFEPTLLRRFIIIVSHLNISISNLFITAFKTWRRRRRRRTLRKQEGSTCCSKEKASSPSSSPCGSSTTNSCSHAGTTPRYTTKRGNALWNWFYHCSGYGIRNGICNCPPCSWRCRQFIRWR